MRLATPALLIAFFALSVNADWLQSRYNEASLGYSSTSAGPSAPDARWISGGMQDSMEPLISSSSATVFYMGHYDVTVENGLFAFDKTCGTLQWKYTANGHGKGVISGTNIILHQSDASGQWVRAVSMSTHVPVWSTQIDTISDSYKRPKIYTYLSATHIIVSSYTTAKVRSVSPSGTLEWTSSITSSDGSAVTLKSDPVIGTVGGLPRIFIFGSLAGGNVELYVLDPLSSGAIIQRKMLPTGTYTRSSDSSPMFYNNYLYVAIKASGTGRMAELYALDPSNGYGTKWSANFANVDSGGPKITSPFAYGNNVYVNVIRHASGAGGRIYAYKYDDGTPQWNVFTGTGDSPIVGSGGVIYSSGVNGIATVALNALSGAIVFGQWPLPTGGCIWQSFPLTMPTDATPAIDGADFYGTGAACKISTTRILGSISVSPADTSVAVGGTVSYTAYCRDTCATAMTCPTIAWTVTSSIGSIASTGTNTGTFTSTAVGSGTVSASASSVTGSTGVTVTGFGTCAVCTSNGQCTSGYCRQTSTAGTSRCAQDSTSCVTNAAASCNYAAGYELCSGATSYISCGETSTGLWGASHACDTTTDYQSCNPASEAPASHPAPNACGYQSQAADSCSSGLA
ncbi:MAG: PQQ-binding-like beta-propeller repeat protein, partial [Candidatus Micrarchaeota archaeon]